MEFLNNIQLIPIFLTFESDMKPKTHSAACIEESLQYIYIFWFFSGPIIHRRQVGFLKPTTIQNIQRNQFI